MTKQYGDRRKEKIDARSVKIKEDKEMERIEEANTRREIKQEAEDMGVYSRSFTSTSGMMGGVDKKYVDIPDKPEFVFTSELEEEGNK